MKKQEKFYTFGQSGVRVEKYGNRNWAVYQADVLLAVTVYKKGAFAVANLAAAYAAGLAVAE
jgi:hypothetical protein